MVVIPSTDFYFFTGDDGERLTLRWLVASLGGAIEVSIECGDHHFRAMLDRNEIDSLRAYLLLDYHSAGPRSFSVTGERGERLCVRHSNMGEPYREGIEITVEGVVNFPDYICPFFESSCVRRIRDLLIR